MSQPIHTSRPVQARNPAEGCKNDGLFWQIMECQKDQIGARRLIAEHMSRDDARLLAAAYNAFDSAAKKLGCNAVELAERLADGEIAELIQTLSGLIKCFENVPQTASMGFDSPPEPASEWDMCAFQELHHARSLLAKMKGDEA